MRLSVTARIALLAITLALISNLVLVAFVWRELHDDAIDALRRDTSEESDALVAVWRSGGLPALGRTIEEARVPGDLSRIVAVVDGQGKLVAGVGPPVAVIDSPGAIEFRIGRIGASPPWSQRDAGYSVQPVGEYRLLSGRLLDDWEQEQRELARALVFAMLLSLGLGVGGGLVVTRYVGRRLNNVADVIEGVAGGDLSRRVPSAAGGDAFDRLSIRLNAMLDKVERLMTELRVITDSMAHDLRSPLARLRTKAENAVLLSDPGQREAALGGLLVETDMVMRMLSMLIEISRSESVTRDRFASVDPADLVEEIAELYAPVVEETGMRFTTILEARPTRLLLHRELMTQAITNLIDNALRHAISGDDVTLRLTATGGEVRIQVEDRGPGIPAADREQALKRFGRLDGARSRPGAGLGLSLIETVARLHGGRIELGDNEPGLVAAIILPAARF
jgi:signal transduction histidine kinase